MKANLWKQTLKICENKLCKMYFFKIVSNELCTVNKQWHNEQMTVAFCSGFPSPVPFNFGGKITKKGIILNTGASQKLEYHHIQYFLSFITESEAHILCRFITQSVIFQAFIYLFIFKVDDCGLQMRRTQN